MSPAKALVGGLVGGCVGAFVADALQSALQTTTPWPILLGGLGAGLGTRLSCGSSRNLTTGLIAAFTAILGVAVVTYVNAAVALRAQRDLQTPIASSFEMPEEDRASGAGEATEVPPEADDAKSDANETPTEDPEPGTTSDAEKDVPPVEPGTSDAESRAKAERPAPEYEAAVAEANRDVGTAKGATPRWLSMEVILNVMSAFLAFVLGRGSAATTTSSSSGNATEGEEGSDQS
jgi:hypothetical protein